MVDLPETARRVLDRRSPYWDKNPRWQTPLVRAAMRKAVRWRHLSPDGLAAFEPRSPQASASPCRSAHGGG